MRALMRVAGYLQFSIVSLSSQYLCSVSVLIIEKWPKCSNWRVKQIYDLVWICHSDFSNWASMQQAFGSINKNLYSTPSRSLLRGAPDSCQAGKRTILRRCWNWEQTPFGRCLRSIGRPFQVVGPTTEKERKNGCATKLSGAEVNVFCCL